MARHVQAMLKISRLLAVSLASFELAHCKSCRLPTDEIRRGKPSSVRGFCEGASLPAFTPCCLPVLAPGRSPCFGVSA